MDKTKELTKYERISRNRIKSLINTYCDGSQREFAKRTGLNIGSVSQYVNGKNVPSSKSAQKIADAFGVAAEWVMGFEPKKSFIGIKKPKKYKFYRINNEVVTVSNVKLSDFAHNKTSFSDVANQNKIILEQLSKDELHIITLYREGKYSDIAALMVKKAAEGK